ncbi:MAG: SEL1-like repeat protein [Candidatus Accumulibacter sp.]|nr:SEL1-like repeat protein [Accumulibacter sp.]
MVPQKAAEQGVTQAQVKLAVMYLTGRGVPKDKTKAAEWFRQAEKN